MKGLTSVKYSGQMPGGNSNFSLGGGYGDDEDRFGGKGQVNNQQAANKAALQKEEEQKQEDDLHAQQQAMEVRMQQPQV